MEREKHVKKVGQESDNSNSNKLDILDGVSVVHSVGVGGDPVGRLHGHQAGVVVREGVGGALRPFGALAEGSVRGLEPVPDPNQQSHHFPRVSDHPIRLGLLLKCESVALVAEHELGGPRLVRAELLPCVGAPVGDVRAAGDAGGVGVVVAGRIRQGQAVRVRGLVLRGNRAVGL